MERNMVVNFLFLILGVWAGEAARQIGRLVIGLAAGLRPATVALGFGALLLRRRVAGAVVALRAVPLLAGVGWKPSEQSTGLRARLWFLIAGGLVGTAAAVVLIRANVPLAAAHTHHPWLQAMGWGVFINRLGRLFPYSMTVGGNETPSEGLQLWRILTRPLNELRESFVPVLVAEAADELGYGDPRIALQLCDQALVDANAQMRHLIRLVQAAAHGKLGDPVKACALAAETLDAAELPPSLRGVALNDWSWHAFCVRDEGDLRLAERRSAEALGLHRKLAATSGTRAAILLWRGRVGQAIPLLKQAVAAASAPSARASDTYLLAMAHASRGESVRAQELLDTARRLAPQHPLLAEASRYVAAAAAGLRVLYAARGRRALLVEPDGVELLEGVTLRHEDPTSLRTAAARRRRLTLSEIDGIHVGHSPAGRAYLIVAQGGRHWRLPLQTEDLMWARMLADDVLNHPAARLLVPPTPAQTPRVTKLIPLLGIASVALVMFDLPGRRGVVSVAMLSLCIVVLLRPGVASALALGAAALTTGASLLLTAKRVEGPAGSLADAAVMCTLGVLSLLAAWRASLEGESAQQGFRLVLAALLLSLGLGGIMLARMVRHGLGGASFLLDETVIAPLVALAATLVWRVTTSSRPAKAPNGP
jgi:tetratricopeptide (TPR) repeat protein